LENAAVPKWFKFCLAWLLLPVCLGASRALFWLLREGSSVAGASLTWVPLLGGAACWWIIYLLLPKPMWVYVLGHELTHALWVWLFEGKVRRIKVSSRGGHVEVTKFNWLIALAPYFFPLYALLIAAVYGLGSLLWDWTVYRPWFLLVLGAAYAFHLTLTWHALHTEQTDVTSQGYVFSGVVIWLGNVAMLLLGLPGLLGVSYAATARAVGLETWEVILGMARMLRIPGV
jgi:hypothetical protein